VETNERVSDVDWAWAIAQIDDVITDKMERLLSTPHITDNESKLLRKNIEKAWQRILQG